MSMKFFSIQSHQGCFLLVYLVGCFTETVFLDLLLARHLNGKKINYFNLNILLNTQFGRNFSLHFVLNPVETTSVGHYTCNTKHQPLRKRHQEITPTVMSLIWNLFQIGFPIQWLKIINSSQFSGAIPLVLSDNLFLVVVRLLCIELHG